LNSGPHIGQAGTLPLVWRLELVEETNNNERITNEYKTTMVINATKEKRR
jgi:hypothetical protein